jgi:DNA-binding MarR family transcriptional regulator/GNAT superfamily N-acetyltransferase
MTELAAAVESFRAFNRVHTRFAGVLKPHYMGSELSLMEARLLYEIATRAPVLARELQDVLDLDAGYASRLLRRFEERGWIARERGPDARQRPIVMLPAGREAFAGLDDATHRHSEQQLATLPPAKRLALVSALDTARAALDPVPAWTLRSFRPGDMGMIAARQSILYAEQFGWGAPMEVLQGEVTSAFLRDFKPGREQCWVAEIAGRMVGSIFAVDACDNVAQLRLLYVEPDARGLGIGEALVRTCVEFARDAGYAKMTLWTHTILTSARRIYASYGFRLVSTETHDHFGDPVEGETWELDFAQSK